MKYVFLKWEQIKTEFPEQWVSIVNLEFSEKEEFVGGMVIANHHDKNELIKKQREIYSSGITFKKHIFKYTGEHPVFYEHELHGMEQSVVVHQTDEKAS